MLGRHRRRLPNINTTLGIVLMLAIVCDADPNICLTSRVCCAMHETYLSQHCHRVMSQHCHRISRSIVTGSVAALLRGMSQHSRRICRSFTTGYVAAFPQDLSQLYHRVCRSVPTGFVAALSQGVSHIVTGYIATLPQVK